MGQFNNNLSQAIYDGCTETGLVNLNFVNYVESKGL